MSSTALRSGWCSPRPRDAPAARSISQDNAAATSVGVAYNTKACGLLWWTAWRTGTVSGSVRHSSSTPVRVGNRSCVVSLVRRRVRFSSIRSWQPVDLGETWRGRAVLRGWARPRHVPAAKCALSRLAGTFSGERGRERDCADQVYMPSNSSYADCVQSEDSGVLFIAAGRVEV